MIAGGNGYPGHDRTKLVEPYNWKTGEQCTLPDMPIYSAGSEAVVMNGFPIFCGGSLDDMEWKSFDERCFRMDKTTKSWKKVRT